MPINILAYLGAISRWFTLKPLIANPLKPTAIVKNAIAITGDFANATTRRNTASRPNPK